LLSSSRIMEERVDIHLVPLDYRGHHTNQKPFGTKQRSASSFSGGLLARLAREGLKFDRMRRRGARTIIHVVVHVITRKHGWVQYESLEPFIIATLQYISGSHVLVLLHTSVGQRICRTQTRYSSGPSSKASWGRPRCSAAAWNRSRRRMAQFYRFSFGYYRCDRERGYCQSPSHCSSRRGASGFKCSVQRAKPERAVGAWPPKRRRRIAGGPCAPSSGGSGCIRVHCIAPAMTATAAPSFSNACRACCGMRWRRVPMTPLESQFGGQLVGGSALCTNLLYNYSSYS